MIMNITEDFCSYEVAKLLKEKVFDELCIFKYNYEGIRMKAGVAIDEWQNSELDDNEYSCPTHQMAMKWLREVHNIHIQIMLDGWALGSHSGFYILLMRMDNDFELLNPLDDEVFFETYEEAVEAALKYVLENLI